jgi:hypothetical protein
MDISAINATAALNLSDGALPLNNTQANIEAAGILLYINNLVATYGSQFGTSGSDKNILAILSSLRTTLQNLDTHYRLSPAIAEGVFAFQGASLGMGLIEDPSVSKWNVFQTLWTTGVFTIPGYGPFTITPFNANDVEIAVETDISADPQNLSLPASGEGTDAAYLFGLSMVENSRNSANFFTNGGASVYAAATAEFFQDAGILSEAAAFPITAAPGQDEQYFVEYLQNYETKGIPFTNAQINAQAASLLAQYIKTLN